jgi:hypothetical protein
MSNESLFDLPVGYVRQLPKEIPPELVKITKALSSTKAKLNGLEANCFFFLLTIYSLSELVDKGTNFPTNRFREICKFWIRDIYIDNYDGSPGAKSRAYSRYCAKLFSALVGKRESSITTVEGTGGSGSPEEQYLAFKKHGEAIVSSAKNAIQKQQNIPIRDYQNAPSCPVNGHTHVSFTPASVSSSSFEQQAYCSGSVSSMTESVAGSYGPKGVGMPWLRSCPATTELESVLASNREVAERFESEFLRLMNDIIILGKNNIRGPQEAKEADDERSGETTVDVHSAGTLVGALPFSRSSDETNFRSLTNVSLSTDFLTPSDVSKNIYTMTVCILQLFDDSVS